MNTPSEHQEQVNFIHKGMHPLYHGWDEHKHQSKFIFEARTRLRRIGLRDLLYAVPNGGKRDPRTAASLKKEGVVAGMPDVNFDYPHGGYHGLRIEMKKLKGRLSPDQERIIPQLIAQGFRVDVCEGWEAALKCFEDYLDNKI